MLHQQLSGRSGSVLPVIVSECPDDQIPLFLGHLKRADVRNASGFDRVVASLRDERARAPASVRKPSRAPVTDYRLVLKQAPEGLSAQWALSNRDIEPVTIASLLSDDDAKAHRWYLGEYLRWPGAGDHVRARAVEKRLEAFGRSLYETFTRPKIEPLAEMMATEGPKQLTLVSDDAAALALPWELLRSSKSALVLQGVVLRRQLPSAEPPKPRPAIHVPLRILLVVSRPSDVGFIDPRSSVRPMLDALDTLGGLVHVELCTPPTLLELTRRLEQAARDHEPIHLVHFDGHGVYMPLTGLGALCFEDADGKNQLVEGTRLGDLLAQARIPVALLEAARPPTCPVSPSARSPPRCFGAAWDV